MKNELKETKGKRLLRTGGRGLLPKGWGKEKVTIQNKGKSLEVKTESNGDRERPGSWKA